MRTFFLTWMAPPSNDSKNDLFSIWTRLRCSADIRQTMTATWIAWWCKHNAIDSHANHFLFLALAFLHFSFPSDSFDSVTSTLWQTLLHNILQCKTFSSVTLSFSVRMLLVAFRMHWFPFRLNITTCDVVYYFPNSTCSVLVHSVHPAYWVFDQSLQYLCVSVCV